MFIAVSTRTMAGAARIAAQRAAEAPKPVHAVILPFKRRQRSYVPLHIPTDVEVSRARHLAFLKAINTRPTRPEDIIRKVTSWYDLSYGDILSDLRFRNFVEARTDCIAAVRKAYPDVAIEHISRWFDRDASAIKLALRKRGLA